MHEVRFVLTIALIVAGILGLAVGVPALGYFVLGPLLDRRRPPK